MDTSNYTPPVLRHFDKSGIPITTKEWATMAARGECLVAKSYINGFDYELITTFVGNLYLEGGSSRRVWWDTTLFDNTTEEGSVTVLEEYRTQSAATAGHKRLLEKLKGELA